MIDRLRMRRRGMSHLNKAAARWWAFGLSTVLILMLAGGPAYAHQQSAVAAAQGGWTATGSMAVIRRAPTATLLPDGKVLVVGGSAELIIGSNGETRGTESLASAELYDPASHTWSTTGSMHQARVYHTATLLPNGKVLVAGGLLIIPGQPDAAILANSELYDPATGTWSMTGRMNHARKDFTATLLPNGYVLAVGGDSSRKTWQGAANRTV